MVVGDTKLLVCMDARADNAAGIADSAMIAAIGDGVTIGLTRVWADRKHPGSERSRVDHKALLHSPLLVQGVGRHEAVGDIW